MKRIAAVIILFAIPLWLLMEALAELNHASLNKAFIGDSITEAWALPRANYGRYGQSSAEILARFPAAISGRGYTRVYMLAGTNDVLLHLPPSETEANLKKMVELARANGVEPVLGEIPPIYAEKGQLQPAVEELNRRIVALGTADHVPVVLYYEVLRGHRSMQIQDGIHMRRRGYWAMEYALLRTSNPF
jgi:lysophospholipase L1-like esterase